MQDHPDGTDSERRDFLRDSLALGGAAAVSGVAPVSAAFAAGSDAPEKKELRIGYVPLSDCASVVIAAARGFDSKYGIRIVPSREASWANVRDKLASGELDAAHSLYGLIYGLHLGIGGPKTDMAVLMTLNANGQAITLSKQLATMHATDGATLAKVVHEKPGELVFAQTFPTGTHAMWLYYWLAAHGVKPMSDVRVITVPPPQMVSNMRVGSMDGYCAGEPWNVRAIADEVGFTAATTQEIWPDHPEKVLAATATFVDRHPNAARAMTAAILEAGRWIEASPANRRFAAEMIAQPECIACGVNLVLDRMQGRYEDGLGRRWIDAHPLKFFGDGEMNFPYLSDGMWFLTQQRRWGLLKEDPDYVGVARAINRTALYRDAATAAGVSVPAADMRSAKLFDGVWDGSDPARYAGAFAVRA